MRLDNGGDTEKISSIRNVIALTNTVIIDGVRMETANTNNLIFKLIFYYLIFTCNIDK